MTTHIHNYSVHKIFSITKEKRDPNTPYRFEGIKKVGRFSLIKCKKSLEKKLKMNEIIKLGFRIGRWDNDEHCKFLESCFKFGNNWRKVKHPYII